MFVIPKKGLKILRPDTGTVLLESGEDVPKTGFWLRRVKQGDVSLVKSKPVLKKKESFKKKIKEEIKTEVE